MSATEMVVSRSSGGGGGGSRWCPTPEQVMLLKGMYKGGLKTPTSTQIQQITARLSIYGKIRGKNVFYWFQNYKARDRQKNRKKLMAMYQHQHLYPPFNSQIHHPFSFQGDSVDQRCKNDVMCDCPLMTVMTMQSTSPYCTRVPPKTLQLFPTTPELNHL